MVAHAWDPSIHEVRKERVTGPGQLSVTVSENTIEYSSNVGTGFLLAVRTVVVANIVLYL